MQSQLNKLVVQRDRGMEKKHEPGHGENMSHEKTSLMKNSTVEENANSKTPGLSSNKCRIVTVSSGSLGSTTSPSKSPPSVLDRPRVLHAQIYTPGLSRLHLGSFQQGFSDQHLHPVAPPVKVPDQ